MSPKGTILVTGTNGGLGTAIVNHILNTPSLADNYTGVYIVRSAATANNLQNALQAAPSRIIMRLSSWTSRRLRMCALLRRTLMVV